ncbi:hypothetical protein SAMN05216526_1186 [Ectothiorhodosinus mongolicus]|uniref:Uncharacterized protein n=1 Tax=Ectothiorhodosinus mongolicus TaxID=233100 RepID=A0A1R3W0J7_9GAMM|nr:hypothetical protein SAMN05216526_1186 [Ectothiorhodosinus mongolicus]
MTKTQASCALPAGITIGVEGREIKMTMAIDKHILSGLLSCVNALTHGSVEKMDGNLQRRFNAQKRK